MNNIFDKTMMRDCGGGVRARVRERSCEFRSGSAGRFLLPASSRGPFRAPHTLTRAQSSVTMADLQMKLLRKKIQKRNEKNKERKLLQKQTEEEESGE